ncbi:MAG: hypothetical protein ABSF03_29595 [Streptosporangiaceae bacterium]
MTASTAGSDPTIARSRLTRHSAGRDPWRQLVARSTGHDLGR